MNDHSFEKRVLFIFFLVGLLVLLVLIASKITVLLVITLTAWVTAATLEPLVRFFMRRKLGRVLSVAITLLLTLLFVILLLVIIVPPVISEIANLVDLTRGLPEFLDRVIADYETLRNNSELLQSVLPPASEDLPERLLGENSKGDLLLTLAEESLPILTNVGTFIGTLLGQLLLYIFLTLMLMLEPTVFDTAIIALIPAEYEERARSILDIARENVELWSRAMLLSIIFTSVLYFIALGLILNLPNALALSVLAGLATIIPTIGNILALIPVIVIAAPLGVTRMILAFVFYTAIGTFQDRVIMPAVIRSELNIPATAQIIAQFILAALIGPIGPLLAVPLLAILITLVREIYVYDVLGKRDPVESSR